MRVSRAYIAGVGTTGVLVASALLLLAVVGTLVGFNGWPGAGAAATTGSLVIDDPESLEVDGPLELASNASPAAAAVARSPEFGTAAALATGLTVTGVPGVRQTAAILQAPAGTGAGARLRGNPTPTRTPGSPLFEPDPDAGATVPLPESSLSAPVNGLAGVLGNTTQGLTDGLGGTVGELSPQLGETVTNTGRLVSDILRGLAPPRR